MLARPFIALAAIAAALSVAQAQQAQMQDYPNRPITLVVPYAAGGGNDVMARIVGEKMSKTLGQQVVIDNRAGAGGALATRQVAKAAPDGYTLVIGGTGSLAVNPTLLPNVGYDVRKDFAPVGMIGSSAMIVITHPSIPANNIAELIALAKKEPDKYTYASAGVGSGIHLGAELFAYMGGIKLVHVPYKGTGPALTDLLGAHVSMYFSSLPSAIGLVKEGKVRALAVTGSKRSDVFPDVPTVAETLPGFEAVLRYGIVAPAGTPRPIIDKLNAALRQALAEPDVIARMARDGTDSVSSTPEEYAADIDREERKWSEVVKRSGAVAK
ncbi:MAG TPA: tripartite tricarboxylate transporter substrate binding protein [Xanthobacteraceae bacterium]|nr:tripartite tricarboxylate transporter substrate binding protein [Xanthobacteraceae bacterium]